MARIGFKYPILTLHSAPAQPLTEERTTVIPEDTVMQHLNALLTDSKPGDTLHHLHVVSTSAVGPLGLPDPDKLQTAICIIDYTLNEAEPVERFVARAIASVGIDHARRGRTIVFAAFSNAAWAVENIDPKLGAQLEAERKIHEHPDMVEVTGVYAACRDGRRWRSRRWLTGPKADQIEDATLLVGRVDPEECGDTVIPAFAALVRKLVGVS